MTKKLFAGVLAAVTIFSFAGARVSAPSVANAATEAEMQAQIAALLAQIAALQSSMGSGSTSACYNFTTDLTLGSNSEAVRALQVYLNNKGYLVATAGVGSKGNESTYFGGLTRTALAKYQAAMNISPAAGYFGPMTRAKVNADCSTTNPGTNPGSGSSSTVLTGGEADLNTFDLRSEESTGNEGESDVEFATAKFDVDDADVRIERVQLDVDGSSTTIEDQPWKFFDSVTVWSGSTKLVSMDTDSRDDWDEQSGNTYRLSITGINKVVKEGDKAELTFSFDINDSIDSEDQAQDFTISIPNDGIRATDAAGIQQYTGDDTDTVSFGFDAADNGDLSVEESDADPSASILVSDDSGTSDEYEVFAFDISNDSNDSDSVITEVMINGTSTYAGGLAGVIRSATLDIDGDEYDGDMATNTITFDDIDTNVDADDSVTAVLKVVLVRNATGTLVFTAAGADVDAEGADSGDSTNVTGSATSDTHTIATSGIDVTTGSTSATTQTPGSESSSTVGSYTINFSVKALEDDIYIPATASTTASTTSGVTYAYGPTSPSVATESAVLTSTADLSGGFYRVTSGSTKQFTLTVTLNPSSPGTFYVRLNSIRFNTSASTSGMTTYTAPSDEAAFRTSAIYVAN